MYVEDQYMWSPHIARLLADALTRNPELHVIVVVPRHADVDGRFALPPNEVGRLEAIRVVEKVAPDRVHVFDLENAAGTPIYVHAKVCVIDDVWACAGSANLNRRSWSHDGELSCAVLDDTRDDREPRDPSGLGDGARRFARDLRLTLLREHLDRGRRRRRGPARPGRRRPGRDRRRGRARRLARRWPGRPAATRPAPPAPPREAAAVDVGVGVAGLPARVRPGRPVGPRPAPEPVVRAVSPPVDLRLAPLLAVVHRTCVSAVTVPPVPTPAARLPMCRPR